MNRPCCLAAALSLLVLGTSCEEPQPTPSIGTKNLDNRSVRLDGRDGLTRGSTYLSVYSQVYSVSEQRKLNLTVTISLRNPHRADSVFVEKASYFNTQGDMVREYLEAPIYVAPMETIEIVIDLVDEEGGTGGNLLFDWATPPSVGEPLFEAVMISTSQPQGLSFITHGQRVR